MVSKHGIKAKVVIDGVCIVNGKTNGMVDENTRFKI